MRRTGKLLLAILTFFSAFRQAYAAEEPDLPSPVTVPISQNQIIKLTDSGVSPAVLHMKLSDSIVFLLNESRDSLTTLKIDYGGKTTHCASSNLKVSDRNYVISKKPFGFQDFASVCFHDKGTYPFVVYGLRPNPSGLNGSIIVE